VIPVANGQAAPVNGRALFHGDFSARASDRSKACAALVPASASTRWIGVGYADGDERDAGIAAWKRAVAGRIASLIVVFASSELDLAAIVGDLRRHVDATVPVVGCTTDGEINAAGPSDRGVVVTSTTVSATTRVTSSFSRWHNGSPAYCGRESPSRGSAATSSPFSSRIWKIPVRRRQWPDNCSRR
jgi:hypothetical protein